MPITIRKQLAPYWFKLDDKDPLGAEFFLRPLNQLQFHGSREHVSVAGKRIRITMEGIENTLRYGLLDWRNVLDEENKPLPCTFDNLEQLDADILKLVAWEVLKASALNSEQKKSSSSPSTSS
jgi:hypothetical protein